MSRQKTPKPARLPGYRTLLQRDMEQVYERERHRYVRCVCGMLRLDGYVCGTCDDDMAPTHPVSSEPLEIGA